MQDFDRRIRSGVTFLYRADGTESQVFEVRMKKRITDNHLFTACRQAFKRYPYLNCKLRLHDDGNYYLDKNPTVPIPQRRRSLRPLGSMATQYNIIDITMFGRSIYVSFHHGMCDGLGIMRFVKTLIYYYLSAKYPRREFRVPDLRRAEDGLLPGETLDPAVAGDFDVDPEKVFRVDGRGGYRLPELKDGEELYCRWELELDEKEFVSRCKENRCTPAVFMSLMFQKAVLRARPDAEGNIVSNVVCDWRDALGLPNTFRNCVTCVPLLYSASDKSVPLPEVGARNREALARQRDKDSARAAASVIKMLADRLDTLPDYESRAKMMSMMSGRINDTFTMSYLGRAGFGDMEEHIDGIHIYTSGDKGVTIEMLALGGKMTVDLKQSFRSDLYCRALVEELQSAGLQVKCSERVDFEVPKDTSRNLPLFERLWRNFIKKFSLLTEKCRRRVRRTDSHES